MAVATHARHPDRSRPRCQSSHPLPAPCQWFPRLASALDRRSAPRLILLFLGAVLARGRRTVTSRIRAAELSAQLRSCYSSLPMSAAVRIAGGRIAFDRDAVVYAVMPTQGGAASPDQRRRWESGRQEL